MLLVVGWRRSRGRRPGRPDRGRWPRYRARWGRYRQSNSVTVAQISPPDEARRAADGPRSARGREVAGVDPIHSFWLAGWTSRGPTTRPSQASENLCAAGIPAGQNDGSERPSARRERAQWYSPRSVPTCSLPGEESQLGRSPAFTWRTARSHSVRQSRAARRLHRPPSSVIARRHVKDGARADLGAVPSSMPDIPPIRGIRCGLPGNCRFRRLQRKAADRAIRLLAVPSADVNVIVFTSGDFRRQPDPAHIAKVDDRSRPPMTPGGQPSACCHRSANHVMFHHSA